MEKLKIMISGANGFIGSNLVKKMFEEGHDVYALINDMGNLWRLKDLIHKITILNLDVTNRSKTFDIFNRVKPEVVLHTAAKNINNLEKNKIKIFDVNLYGTMNLLDASDSVETSTFVNTGTVFEYGAKQLPITEEDKLTPNTDYSISKAFATEYCLFKSKLSKMNIRTLRLFTPYGYFEDKFRLIPYILASLLKNKKMYLSNPLNVRDFVFIEDVMEAYSSVISANLEENGEIFNIGYGVQHSVNDVIKISGDLVGITPQISWGKMGRPGDESKVWQADITKARNLLHWNPKIHIKEGISKTLEWIKQNMEDYS